MSPLKPPARVNHLTSMMTTTPRPRLALGAVILVSVLVAGCSSTSSPTAPTVTGTPPVVDTPTTPAPPPVVETPAPTPPPPPQTARYRFTFDALWSAATHPQDFPGDPHFSPLVGATHLATTRFWQEGAVATDGIRDMAERGLTIRL